MAAEVGLLFAPIDAVRDQGSAPWVVQDHPEVGQAVSAAFGELVPLCPSSAKYGVRPAFGVGLDAHQAAGDERLGDGYAESAGQVVIAGAARS